jgi:hypothetical protein
MARLGSCLFVVLFLRSFAAIPFSAIGLTLVAHAEHGILHLVDQGAAHGDRNIAEQEQG